MQNINDLIEKTSIAKLQIREDEYIKNDNLHCKKCDSARSLDIEILGEMRKVRCICACEKYALLKREEQEELNKKIYRIEKLRLNSLMGEKYKKVRFESTVTSHNESFKNAFIRCRKFAENIDIVLKDGLGLYIYGGAGCGKTHLTACIANVLIDRYIEVVFTNFFEISKDVRSSFNDALKNESEVLNKYKKAEILFVDDLGTESLSKNSGDNFLQNLLFEVINFRYNNNKTTVFTSNYDFKELIVDRYLESKTVDRIRELSSAVIFIDGKSFRGKAKQENLPF